MFAEGGITVGLCDLSTSFEDCTKVFKVTPPNVIPMESTISPSKYRAKQKMREESLPSSGAATTRSTNYGINEFLMSYRARTTVKAFPRTEEAGDESPPPGVASTGKNASWKYQMAASGRKEKLLTKGGKKYSSAKKEISYYTITNLSGLFEM